MALHVLPILKALAPLIAEAGGLAAGLRSSGRSAKGEERIEKLERDMSRAGEVLAGLAQQLQAVAQELRQQAEATERLRQQARWALIVAGVALVVSAGALIASFVR